MSQGGAENGNLACTFDDFTAYGVRRNSIGRAIDDLIEAGFVEQTFRGRPAKGQFPGEVARYRLTFFGTVDENDGVLAATNDWYAPPATIQ